MPRNTKDNGNIYQQYREQTYLHLYRFLQWNIIQLQEINEPVTHINMYASQNYGVKWKKHVTEDYICYSTYKMFKKAKIMLSCFKIQHGSGKNYEEKAREWMMYTEFRLYLFILRAREEFVRKEFSKRILECDNALLLGLGSGIWMFSLLLSLNCRYTFSKTILYAYYI